MKYLFWIALILVVWWAWRRAQTSGQAQAPTATAAPQEMVTCTHCGLHLPHDEAVSGTRGPYCSVAHRQAAGDRNPN